MTDLATSLEVPEGFNGLRLGELAKKGAGPSARLDRERGAGKNRRAVREENIVCVVYLRSCCSWGPG